MNQVHLHKFQSPPPETPFAPWWNYIIARKQTDIDVQELRRVILIKEKEIVEKYPNSSYEYSNYSDGYTGLGPNSLTSRYSFFNLLEWDYPVIKDLHKNIKIFHDEYLKGTIGEQKDLPLGIRCWANVMRKGQQIKKHAHSSHPWSFLSGHFCVAAEVTTTNYFHQYNDNIEFIKNEPGQMTLFPNWVPHNTSKHKGDSERISIAFDIVFDAKNGYKCGHGKDPENDNTIPL